MTSTPNWSDMTDSTDKSAAITTGLGASPSQTVIGEDHIAENSDIFREAIQARNIYAAWARKLTNAKPSDPDVQLYNQEVKKADIIKMGRTILLERRQSESVGRRNSRTTFLRSDWPRPFARREVGVEMELGRSENKRPEQRRS
ncbi:hypothetical protein TNCV_4816811 [Trichonephila clavipes]|nr:hypothetical protein TNCV_4816811 [Trichonephila clavipes]